MQLIRQSVLCLFACSLASIAVAQSAPATWTIEARPSVRIGARFGSGAEEFTRLTGVLRGARGQFVIVDELSLKYFDRTGRHLRTMGRRGAGPGEFRTIMSARSCGHDAVFAYDPSLMRITVVSGQGELVTVRDLRALGLQVPAYDFWCAGPDELLFLQRSTEPPGGIGPRRPTVSLSLWTRSNGLQNIARIPSGERYFDGGNDFPRPLGKPTSIAASRIGIYVGTGDSLRLLRWSRAGVREAAVELPGEVLEVTQADVAAFVEQQLERRRGAQNYSSLQQLYGELEYPDQFPSHGRILIDGSDNLWVEEYRRPRSDSRRWFILDASGIHIATLSVPATLEVHHADVASVTGVWRDEDGVEYVQQHVVRKR